MTEAETVGVGGEAVTASEVKALIVGLVLVCGALVGAEFWDHRDADEPPVAHSAAPVSAKPQVQPDAKQPIVQGVPRQSADPGQGADVPKAEARLEPEPNLEPKLGSKPEPGSGSGEPPHFDVVRVEPSGDAVVAGKGDPKAKIQLLASGQVVAEATADADGNFVILPPALEPGNHDLTLRQIIAGKAAVDSTESVAVSVPEKGGGEVVVALAEPGKPTKLLSGPPKTQKATGAAGASVASVAPETGAGPPAAGKTAGSHLVIRSVELENGNGFYASGTAAPGTRVQIYLNGSHLAAVVAGADGQWSVTIRKGLTGGHYAVRADADGEGESVSARVEVPFDVPMAMAQAAASPGSGQEPPLAPNPSDVAGLGPEPASRVSVAPEPQAEVPTTPRPDLAAAAKAAGARAEAADAKAEPSDARVKAADRQVSDANAVIDQVETALVIPGDNLWNISRARLGHGKRFTQIYAANVSQIRDPKLIYPGQVFVVPSR